jgi:type I restriction enzyme M protein
MNINENIPQLFRDIFKGAFLPYRDPETLNLFLKEINGFAYDHSERLGDAFEYLLSVLSSQGDAGQFRTPRHIIDFIVEIVNPAKEDTVLDPACGTAGFLISSYKHILRQNTKDRPGDLLTADDKGRLVTNFCGYDISPDMVRLSLVNMYLHSFANPSIHEYDTLTSEDRWDERYDVIMANPPFMSPKGGIRPHSRFTIKAKRSEVLFVDYIAEHLNVHGRAGVIVPEGIIFQSQNAYKNLRKMLIDEGYLYAVISLPAGVFQPYSGVKTSILLMDKALAKKTDKIFFVKVANDGFDLGAQRMPIDKNDLPQALEIVNAWKQTIAEGNGFELDEDGRAIAHAVSKKKIAESSDWNLSGDRYKEVISYANVKWPMVELGDVCEINPKKSELKGLGDDLDVSFVPMSDMNQGKADLNVDQTKKLRKVRTGYSYFRNLDVLLAKITPCFENGKSGIARGLKNGIGFGSTEFIVIRPDRNRILPELIYYFVSDSTFLTKGKSNMTGSAGQQRLSLDFVKRYTIPLPPLEVQEKIVAELDGYQKIIDGAKQVVENYKPTIKIDPDWPLVELEEISHMKRGPFGGSLKKKIFVKQGYKVYEQKHAIRADFTIGNYFIDENKYREMEAFAIAPKDLLISCSGTMGKVVMVPEDAPKGVINQALLKVTPNKSKVLPFYLKCIIESEEVQRRYFQSTNGAAIQNVGSMKVMKRIPVPLPPLKIQQKLVAEIESERELVEANKKLIEIFEKKIKDKIGEVWGE